MKIALKIFIAIQPVSCLLLRIKSLNEKNTAEFYFIIDQTLDSNPRPHNDTTEIPDQ